MTLFMRIIIAMMLYLSLPIQAGIIIGGTRVIFAGNSQESALGLSNPEPARAYLVQSWVEPESGGGKAPFLVTPPLFRLDPGQENILRIVLTRGGLPQDRESLFWLNVKSVPELARNESEANVLHLSVKTRLKLFYRPAALARGAQEAYKKLAFSRQGSDLVVRNPTPYYQNLKQLSVNDHAIQAEISRLTLPPFGEMRYPLPVANATQVSWRTITDYGNATPLQQQALDGH